MKRKVALTSSLSLALLIVAAALALTSGAPVQAAHIREGDVSRLAPRAPSAPAACPTDLFFSEYIEGSSNNKALEIYNGTGADITLTGNYTVGLFFNGSTAVGNVIAPVGILTTGEVYVIAHSSAVVTITAQADLTTTLLSFNGDDAVVLYHNGTIVDVIGQIGTDPGTEWGTGLTSTADNTLVRKSSIIAGDTNGGDAFDPATEWNGNAIDTFTFLGAHTADPCQPDPTADLSLAKSGPATAFPGEMITYTVSVSNTGTTTATGTLVTDTLPTGLTFVTYTTSLAHTFSQPNAQTLVWDLGDVTTDTANATIEVATTVDGSVLDGALLTNTVIASTSTTETVISNNVAQTTTAVLAPVLDLNKSVEPYTGVPYHGEVTYTLVLNNSGGQDAGGVLLTDTLPAEVDFARWVDQPIGAGVTADEVTWSGTVDAGGTITFTFVVTHVGNYSDIVTNTAEYTHASGNSSAQAEFTVVSSTPDLSISKSASPNVNVARSGEVTYTVTLANAGAADAPGVLFTDTLPIETGFVRWVNQPAGAAETAGAITWNGTLSAAQSIDFTFVVTHTGDYGDVITNTARYAHTSRSGSADAAFTVEPLYPITFVYHDAEDVVASGEDVYLAGSFNGWNANAISLTADGGFTAFSTTLSLPAGSYEYKYVVKSGGDQWDWLNTNNRAYTVTGAATLDDYRHLVAGYAHLMSPAAISITLGDNTGPIQSEVFYNGVTNPAGVGRGVRAQTGYGVGGDLTAWMWVNGAYDSNNGNNDVFSATLTPASGGVFSYAVRFDGNWGAGNPNAGWTYGDLDGVFPGEPFELDQTGVLTVSVPSTSLIINELDSDTPGTDAAEFVELYDGGAGNTALDGMVLVFYNGSNDQSYYAIDLDGYSTDANGYFVAGNVGVPGVVITFAGNLLQNGADAAALYFGNATDFPNFTPVTVNNLIDAVVYDTADLDDPGLLALLNPGQPQVDENGGGNGATHSIGRCPNGSGGARNTSTYLTQTPTPGGSNACPPAIDAAIAKTGPSSLLPGGTVTYTLTYSNAGLQALTGVLITDVLPSGMIYISDTSGLTLTGLSPLVWDVGTLPAGTVRSFNLVAQVPTTATGTLTNTAYINSIEVDADPADNETAFGAPVATYDLEVFKSVDTAEVFIPAETGKEITYTIQINNRSILTDTTVLTVTDVLPFGFAYVRDDSGFTPSGTGTSGDPLVWSITNTLAANTSLTFHVVVSATDAITASGLIKNQVSVTSLPADESPANNAAQDSGVFVWRLIDLATARTLPLGAPVYVSGYVNFPPGLVSGVAQNSDEFMMQDATIGTTGISVFYSGSTAKFAKFSVGDEVTARGTLAQFNGKLEVVLITPTRAISTGVNIPLTPLVRNTGQIGESTEGVLVQVEGTVTSVTPPLHVFIDDGSGVVDIFRDQDVPGLSFADFQVGDRLRVIGVGTQFDNTAPYDSGYEVSVRYQSDISEYPAVTNVGPANNATNVAVGANVTATFNVTMTNVSGALFTLTGPGGAVAGTVSYDAGAKTATFDPAADLAHGTRYTATLSAELAASNGLTLTTDYVWSFTTEASPSDLSTSIKSASASGSVKPGDLITYTIGLTNTGGTDVNVMVVDVLGSYYTVFNALDFSEAPTGTLSWLGVVPGNQTVTLRFVARVKGLSELPFGVTVLANTATVDDGINPTLNLVAANPPTVAVYGNFLPVIRR